MDGFDTSPIDPRLMPKPVLPVANGAPAQPDTPAVLPRVPMQTSQPQQTQGLAFPQVGIQGRSPVQEKLASTQEQGSGISRIHNPVLKTLATVGDVLAGTFAPRAEQLIPGTEGNYALHLARAGNAVKGEREQQAAQNEATLQRAQAHHAEAEANALENPQDKAPTNAIELFLKDPESFKAYQEASAKAQETKQPQFIKDGEGNLVGLIDPQGKIHSASDPNLDPETRAVMEAAKPKQETGGTVHEDEQGNMWVVKPDGSAVPVTPKQAQAGTSGVPAASPQQLKGKPAAGANAEEQFIQEYQAAHKGATVAQAQRAYKLNEQLPPQRDPEAALDRESARFAKPHEAAISAAAAQLEKIADAKAMINGSAEAQALGIPKVLTALVSGQGSGVRITQPELNAIGKARGVSGDVEGFLNSISGKGKLTATQKQQLTQILDDVAARVQQKQAIANEAKDRINGARSREEIIQADKEATKKLTDLQTAASGTSGAPGVRVQQNSKGEFRYSTDGGKTWQTGKPPQ